MTHSSIGRAVGRTVAAVSLASRKRKLRLFLETMRPKPATTVVDVGVADAAFGASPGHDSTLNFFEALYPWPERVTAVGDTGLRAFRAAFPGVTAVTADGRRLPFADGEFDIGFSNAVVEHLPTEKDQQLFVHELCRVARRVFVTTPNRLFPVELHTLLPLVHWLPDRPRVRVLEALGRGEHGNLRLLTPASFRRLFPYEVELRNLALTLVAFTPPRAPRATPSPRASAPS